MTTSSLCRCSNVCLTTCCQRHLAVWHSQQLVASLVGMHGIQRTADVAVMGNQQMGQPAVVIAVAH